MSDKKNRALKEEYKRIEERAKLELLNNIDAQGLLNFDYGDSNKVLPPPPKNKQLVKDLTIRGSKETLKYRELKKFYKRKSNINNEQKLGKHGKCRKKLKAIDMTRKFAKSYLINYWNHNEITTEQYKDIMRATVNMLKNENISDDFEDIVYLKTDENLKKCLTNTLYPVDKKKKSPDKDAVNMSLTRYTKMSPCRIPIKEVSPTNVIDPSPTKTSHSRVVKLFKNKNALKLSSDNDSVRFSLSGIDKMTPNDEKNDLNAPYSPSDFESMIFD